MSQSSVEPIRQRPIPISQLSLKPSPLPKNKPYMRQTVEHVNIGQQSAVRLRSQTEVFQLWRLTSLSSFFCCSCQLGLPYLLVSDTESGSRSVESPSSASGRSPFARMRPFHDLSVAPCLDPLMLFPSCSGRLWFKLLGQGQRVASATQEATKSALTILSCKRSAKASCSI